MTNNKKILIAPLDWGLGHATRCIPLIAYLLEKKFDVIVAGNHKTNALIQIEFPALQYIYLKGYNISYSSSKFLLPFSIAMQIPKIMFTIWQEHIWLKKVIHKEQINYVISDNRYGLYANSCQSIFLTHQLNIQVPQSQWLQKWVNAINHFFIRKFSRCWVPDFFDNSLAGKLSSIDNKQIETPIDFIGPLSRFSKPIVNSTLNYILILLSGPEPQRTILENIIIQQASALSYEIIVVRGLLDTVELPVHATITFFNHLPKEPLQQYISEAKYIVSRAGYSSIMDFVKLQKHAILIPTPGQTEQEYLSNFLENKHWFIAYAQKDFNLAKAIEAFDTFRFSELPTHSMDKMKLAIDQWK